jgi:hypothetical protein
MAACGRAHVAGCGRVADGRVWQGDSAHRVAGWQSADGRVWQGGRVHVGVRRVW